MRGAEMIGNRAPTDSSKSISLTGIESWSRYVTTSASHGIRVIAKRGIAHEGLASVLIEVLSSATSKTIAG